MRIAGSERLSSAGETSSSLRSRKFYGGEYQRERERGEGRESLESVNFTVPETVSYSLEHPLTRE